jgi:hypothetical protein
MAVRWSRLHLIVGDEADPLCAAVQSALAANGAAAAIVGNPFLDSPGISWRFDSASTDWTFELHGQPISEGDVISVLYRGPAAFDPPDWPATEAAYAFRGDQPARREHLAADRPGPGPHGADRHARWLTNRATCPTPPT